MGFSPFFLFDVPDSHRPRSHKTCLSLSHQTKGRVLKSDNNVAETAVLLPLIGTRHLSIVSLPSTQPSLLGRAEPLTANSALANEHAKCYCVLNNASHKDLTDKACEIYRTTMKIFEKDSPESVNTTMLWHVSYPSLPQFRDISYLPPFHFKLSCYSFRGLGLCDNCTEGWGPDAIRLWVWRQGIQERVHTSQDHRSPLKRRQRGGSRIEMQQLESGHSVARSGREGWMDGWR